ncbi:MAG: hypothetical protein H6737_01965 [Alphaproteobacteria bacterium]|nr:hypothetical protein [Alphaproteobacteria bacterium]
MEDDIGALDVGIVWVLEADPSGQAGTAQSCYDFVSASGASTGWCVGDAETVPDPGEWDDSPFSVGRGFDIVVPRETMRIEYTTNHGTPSGNDNPTAEELLAAIEGIVSGL